MFKEPSRSLGNDCVPENQDVGADLGEHREEETANTRDFQIVQYMCELVVVHEGMSYFVQTRKGLTKGMDGKPSRVHFEGLVSGRKILSSRPAIGLFGSEAV
jgi:hypothetical protein